MNFENFRKDIESKLNQVSEFELQEYHFEPHSFGNGILVYRIKGRIHKFIFDGRESELTWFIGKSHQKYFGGKLTEFKRVDGLEISKEELESGIKNSAQHRIKKIAKLVLNQRQLHFCQLLNFLRKFLADKIATFLIQQRCQ